MFTIFEILTVASASGVYIYACSLFVPHSFVTVIAQNPLPILTTGTKTKANSQTISTYLLYIHRMYFVYYLDSNHAYNVIHINCDVIL